MAKTSRMTKDSEQEGRVVYVRDGKFVASSKSRRELQIMQQEEILEIVLTRTSTPRKGQVETCFEYDNSSNVKNYVVVLITYEYLKCYVFVL